MTESASITARVLDTLVRSGLITPEQIGIVRDAAAADGGDAGAVLLERALVTREDVATALEDELGVPRVDLSSYAPDEAALSVVPAEVARVRRLLPLFEIEGALTVAIGDPMDVFLLDGVAAQLQLELDPVLTDGESLAAALAHHYPEGAAEAPAAVEAHVEEKPAAVEPQAVPSEEGDPGAAIDIDAAAPPPAPVVAEPEGLPSDAGDGRVHTVEEVAAADLAVGASAIDLDVLAVADARNVALLVTEILADAISRDATRIHLLPYKDDFFLVYRIAGRLEKVAAAPLSMQGALVDAFKSFAKLSGVPSSLSALGRINARMADRDVVLTVSAVPTVAGQRVVVSLEPQRSQLPSLADLGMSEAESRALHAMVERGRGILLVCAPVAAGRSTTYYALLNHAASVGKTVYSVERSVQYEIPAVAQVMVTPGSAANAAAHITAGLQQDTDVIAVDSLHTAEEIHLAVEAAGLGKLVIATFAAGDIAAGVRRMLDLGTEPVSLAAALTLGVGQRLVRTNCPKCTAQRRSQLAGAMRGVPADFVERAGKGCDACGKTGFGRTTGLFEVLPFAEPVRAAVARGSSVSELAEAARAAGMRPLEASGVEKARAGLVSLEELDRVLRLS